VKDDGVGIAPAHLDHIFEMFAQMDQTLERTRGGLGIGLTLAKRLVEMHGGTIRAHSAGLRQGAELEVRLPVLWEEEIETSTPPVRAAPPSSRRILVVDDNPDSAESLAMLLSLSGNETFTANDGAEALEAAGRLVPDILLLDIGLPKMNGYEVCRSIRSQPWGANMTIVALTGWGQDEDRRRSVEAGFDGHLVKPIDHGLLASLLADVGAQRAQQTIKPPAPG
jgi:CheY-like chemotaxis protein